MIKKMTNILENNLLGVKTIEELEEAEAFASR